jgi:ABC-2 type transport system permease protein
MLNYNFKYELKLLLRNNWIQLLSVFLLVAFAFATYNGTQKMQKIKDDVSIATSEANTANNQMVKVLDSIEKGHKVNISSRAMPTNPMNVGNSYPRVAAVDLKPMSFISIGQADLFKHHIKPRVIDDNFELNFTEMTSPIQLLFGNFDLAFVIVYLLPLLIIAFSYNVLSAEKESGALRLIASQPIEIKNWVFQKLLIRFFWLSILVAVSLIVVLSVFGVNILNEWSMFLGLLTLILGYMLFWFVLAFLINLLVGSSAKNAISMLSLWVVFVMLVPSILNQVSHSLYPMPSRTLMINEMREINANLTEKQDKILDNYLRDHPEYALNDSTQARTFWHSYMATKQMLKQELEPVAKTYDVQLQKQQDWLDNLKWMSPSIIIQESLNSIAGTSSQDYKNFRAQALDFSESWRQHFMTFLYNNKSFSAKDVANLPSFKYEQQTPKTIGSLLIILGITAVIYLIGLFISNKRKDKSRLIISK